MPVYLAHGFRWPRGGFTGIRVHVIIHNLEDTSAEYIQTPRSQTEILGSFRKVHPELMKVLDPVHLSSSDSTPTQKGIQLLEQYDPLDETSELAASQPHAFVCDRVVMIAAGSSTESALTTLPKDSPPADASSKDSKESKDPPGNADTASIVTNAQALSLDVEAITTESTTIPAAENTAFAELRDALASGEKIGWWVVYNGDPERPFPDSEDDEDYQPSSSDSEDDDEEYEEDEPLSQTDSQGSASTATPPATKAVQIAESKKPKEVPAPALAERKRPPQPAPKPQMFERSGPAAGGNNTAPIGKETKGKEKEKEKGKEKEKEKEKERDGKPRVAPKSESLKKKFLTVRKEKEKEKGRGKSRER